MTARALTEGVRWCPACVVRAQQRGTVRTVPNTRVLDQLGQHVDLREPATVLVLWYAGRAGGELWSVIPREGQRCACCETDLAIAFEVRPARKGRGLGRSPREAPQGPGLFDRDPDSKT